MAEQERPAEGRRRKVEEPSSLERPGEVLLWLVSGAAVLLGWVPQDIFQEVWVKARDARLLLRLPVMVHQVPVGDGQGGMGMLQVYAPLPVTELVVDRMNATGYTWDLPGSDLARIHAEAWRQRGGTGRILALPPGSKLAH